MGVFSTSRFRANLIANRPGKIAIALNNYPLPE
jgi:hypothetical protein